MRQHFCAFSAFCEKNKNISESIDVTLPSLDVFDYATLRST